MRNVIISRINDLFQSRLIYLYRVKVREAIQKKRIYKDIGFICFDPLPPPPIKNKDILLNYLTPSLLPKIRTYEPFVFGFKNQILHF